jgi:hypothetical protein
MANFYLCLVGFAVFHLPRARKRSRFCEANGVSSFCGHLWRQAAASCLDHNAFHPRKGKVSESWRRKASGLGGPVEMSVPRGGWAAEGLNVRRRARSSRDDGIADRRTPDPGTPQGATQRLALLFKKRIRGQAERRPKPVTVRGRLCPDQVCWTRQWRRGGHGPLPRPWPGRDFGPIQVPLETARKAAP